MGMCSIHSVNTSLKPAVHSLNPLIRMPKASMDLDDDDDDEYDEEPPDEYEEVVSLIVTTLFCTLRLCL